MKFNYALLSRVFIALLFVVAGIQKALNFQGPTGTVSFMDSLGIPLPVVATVIVILIEVVVAGLYAYGYRVCYTGGILVAFTVLATVLVHRDFSIPMNVMMALKNLAIIGGILATTGVCSCQRCTVVTKGDK